MVDCVPLSDNVPPSVLVMFRWDGSVACNIAFCAVCVPLLYAFICIWLLCPTTYHVVVILTHRFARKTLPHTWIVAV
jgi:hypothetical protein